MDCDQKQGSRPLSPRWSPGSPQVQMEDWILLILRPGLQVTYSSSDLAGVETPILLAFGEILPPADLVLSDFFQTYLYKLIE